MTDGPALLATILANPADDAPRLVYADWLEENGEPERAEFVRVGCEVARLDGRCERGGGISRWCEGDNGKHHPNCSADALRCRERNLLRVNAAFWGADLFIPTCPENGVCEWRRGFIEGVTLTAADALAHLDAILAAHPVTTVRLTTGLNPFQVGKLMAECGDGDSARPERFEDGIAYLRAPDRLLRRRWERIHVWCLPEAVVIDEVAEMTLADWQLAVQRLSHPEPAVTCRPRL